MFGFPLILLRYGRLMDWEKEIRETERKNKEKEKRTKEMNSSNGPKTGRLTAVGKKAVRV